MIFLDIADPFNRLNLTDFIHESKACLQLNQVQKQLPPIALLLQNVLIFYPFSQIHAKFLDQLFIVSHLLINQLSLPMIQQALLLVVLKNRIYFEHVHDLFSRHEGRFLTLFISADNAVQTILHLFCG